MTLDDLSILSAAEGDFKKVGWVPADHELAPTVSIADLLCLVDILDHPLLLLHYLSERTHFQKACNVLGDEMDFLGLYLKTGFNIGVPNKEMLFALTDMSQPIDRYYTSRDEGIARPKPKPNLSPLFRKIIDRLHERQSRGWTTAGVHLLSAASPPEQRRLGRSLDQLRTMVRENYRDPEHVNSVWIQPPQKHKARVGFYLFPERLRAERRMTMEQLGAEALDADGVERILLFARSTEGWNVPYEAFLYAEKR